MPSSISSPSKTLELQIRNQTLLACNSILTVLANSPVKAVVAATRLAVRLVLVDKGEDTEEALLRIVRTGAVMEALGTVRLVARSLRFADGLQIRSLAGRSGAGCWGGLGKVSYNCGRQFRQVVSG